MKSGAVDELIQINKINCIIPILFLVALMFLYLSNELLLSLEEKQRLGQKLNTRNP